MTSLAAIAQMASTASIQDNLQVVAALMEEAADRDTRLVVFPENFAFMGLKDTDKYAIAEIPGKGAIQDFIQQLSKRYGIWIIAGTVPLKTAGTRVRAACLVYDAKGMVVARYDKIHLFDVQINEREAHQESQTIEPGNAIVVVDTPVGKIGLTVCYDLRFPELYRHLTARGAEIFSIPSAFTATTGKAHWEALVRARAIENLAYVLAPNQGGTHAGGRETFGHSMIVQPWGNVAALIQQTPSLAYVEIDLDNLATIRKQFPCNEHHVLKTSG